MKTVGIIIVNYRTPELVIDCLKTLIPEIKNSPFQCRVIIADNFSGDHSAESLSRAIREEQCEEWVKLLELDTNRGFAAGNNRAIEYLYSQSVIPDYFWLLNPDTVVHPGSLDSLVDFLNSNHSAGIAGSRLENRDGSPQRSAFRFPTILGEVDNGMRLGIVSRLLSSHIVAPPVETRTHACGWVSGASMMVRKEVFDAIGFMDEGYFLYFEETDLCLRANRAGWQSWYVPSSRVIHLVGQSTGIKERRRVPRYVLESRGRFFSKNHGRLYRFGADLAWTLSYCTWRVRSWIQRKPDTDPPQYFSDFILFNFFNTYRPSR